MHASMSTVVPNHNPNIEQKAAVLNKVKEYKLTDEELAYYRSLPVPKPLRTYAPRKKTLQQKVTERLKCEEQKPAAVEVEPIKIEEEITMTTNPISREEYLIRRKNGEKRTVIMDDLGLNTTQAYKLLTDWGIKDMKVEQKFIDLIPGRGEQPRGIGAINAAHQEEMVKIDPPVAVEDVKVLREKDTSDVTAAAEISTAKDQEIERLRNELADALGQRNQLQIVVKQMDKQQELEEIERLRKELKDAMTLDRYQQLASRTANTDWDLISVRVIRNPKLLPLLNFALGAAGEAGEIADEIKKVIFHGHELDSDKIMKEAGDALWYLSQLTRTIGYSFDTAAERNIEKLQERYPEGFSEERSLHREVKTG